MKFLQKLAWIGLLCLVVLNILPHIGLTVLSEWAASFLPFILLYNLPTIGILYLLQLRWQWFLVWLPTLLWNVAVCSPYLFPGQAMNLEGPRLKICSVNVHRVNLQHQPIIDVIKEEKPDLVFVQEIDAAWEADLRKSLQTDYSFIHALPDDQNFGIMLLSKIPIKDLEVAYTTDYQMPYYDFELEDTERKYHCLAMHTYPPSSPSKLPWRNSQLALLAKLSRPNSILMGDFNVSTFSPSFRRLLQEASMQDPRKQAGILNTWPASFPFLGANIDHILVGKDIRYGKLKRMGDIGSDHLPLILEIQ